MQPNQIGGGYMFYPRVVQQQTGGRSGEQQSGGTNPSRLIYNTNNLNYLPPKDDFNKSGSCARFLSAFSHLPCLPSSMSRLTKGIIGFIIFLIFLSVVIIALGLIPLYLQLAENNTPKSSFSIDVKNGLNLQNQPLSSILTTSDSNRTAEQNATLFSGITTLSDQLNDKIKLKLDPNIEKFFNVRLAPNQQGTIDVSFTIKTKPITRSDLNTFKSNIPSLMRSSNAFGDIKLPNSTLFVSPNAEFAEPVEGEISVKPLQLSQTATSSAQLSGQIASLGLEDSGNGVESSLEADLKNPQASRPGQQQKRPSNNKNNRGGGKNQHEHDDGEIDQAAIAQSSNIKLLPNYFPPNYLPPPPQIPPPPIYNNQPGAYQQQPNNNAYQQPSSNSAYQATNNKNNGAYQGNGNNGYQSNNGYQAPSNNYQQPNNGYQQPPTNSNGYQPVSNGYQQNNQYLPPPPPPPQYQPYNGNNYNNNNGYNDEKKEYYEEEKKEDKKEDKEDIFKKIKKLKDEGEEKRKKDMEEEKAKIEKMLHEDKIEKEKEKERKMLEKEEEKIKEIKRKLEELNEEKMKSNYGKLKSSAHQPEQIALKSSSSQAAVEKKSDVAVELVGKSNPEAASTEKKAETLKEAVKNN